jgi:hypothetical protein
MAAGILDAYQQLRKRLAGITQINWMPSVLDLREQLDALVFRGFLQQVPFEHLKDYPRYLKAANQRTEKLTHAAGRDQERLRELTPLLEQWRERNAAARAAGATTRGWTRSAGCWKSCACRCSRSSSAPPETVQVFAVGWISAAHPPSGRP